MQKAKDSKILYKLFHVKVQGEIGMQWKKNYARSNEAATAVGGIVQKSLFDAAECLLDALERSHGRGRGGVHEILLRRTPRSAVEIRPKRRWLLGIIREFIAENVVLQGVEVRVVVLPGTTETQTPAAVGHRLELRDIGELHEAADSFGDNVAELLVHVHHGVARGHVHRPAFQYEFLTGKRK